MVQVLPPLLETWSWAPAARLPAVSVAVVWLVGVVSGPRGSISPLHAVHRGEVGRLVGAAAVRFEAPGVVLSRFADRVFGAYMMKAKQKMKIEVNRESLQRAVS